MPGRPGGDCPSAIVQELFTQIDKIQSLHYFMAPHNSTDTDNFNFCSKKAEKHYDNLQLLSRSVELIQYSLVQPPKPMKRNQFITKTTKKSKFTVLKLL